MSDGNLFRAFDVSASGLTAQRTRLNVISANIANAQTTRTVEGGPYRRKVAQTEARGMAGQMPAFLEAGRLYPSGARAGELPLPPFDDAGEGVEVVGIAEDMTLGPLVYDPGHPDADANGYVQMPNVDLTQEIVSLMEARRFYEANATVFQAIKNMLQRAAQI